MSLSKIFTLLLLIYLEYFLFAHCDSLFGDKVSDFCSATELFMEKYVTKQFVANLRASHISGFNKSIFANKKFDIEQDTKNEIWKNLQKINFDALYETLLDELHQGRMACKIGTPNPIEMQSTTKVAKTSKNDALEPIATPLRTKISQESVKFRMPERELPKTAINLLTSKFISTEAYQTTHQLTTTRQLTPITTTVTPPRRATSQNSVKLKIPEKDFVATSISLPTTKFTENHRPTNQSTTERQLLPLKTTSTTTTSITTQEPIRMQTATNQAKSLSTVAHSPTSAIQTEVSTMATSITTTEMTTKESMKKETTITKSTGTTPSQITTNSKNFQMGEGPKIPLIKLQGVIPIMIPNRIKMIAPTEEKNYPSPSRTENNKSNFQVSTAKTLTIDEKIPIIFPKETTTISVHTTTKKMHTKPFIFNPTISEAKATQTPFLMSNNELNYTTPITRSPVTEKHISPKPVIISHHTSIQQNHTTTSTTVIPTDSTSVRDQSTQASSGLTRTQTSVSEGNFITDGSSHKYTTPLIKSHGKNTAKDSLDPNKTTSILNNQETEKMQSSIADYDSKTANTPMLRQNIKTNLPNHSTTPQNIIQKLLNFKTYFETKKSTTLKTKQETMTQPYFETTTVAATMQRKDTRVDQQFTKQQQNNPKRIYETKTTAQATDERMRTQKFIETTTMRTTSKQSRPDNVTNTVKIKTSQTLQPRWFTLKTEFAIETQKPKREKKIERAFSSTVKSATTESDKQSSGTKFTPHVQTAITMQTITQTPIPLRTTVSHPTRQTSQKPPRWRESVPKFFTKTIRTEKQERWQSQSTTPVTTKFTRGYQEQNSEKSKILNNAKTKKQQTSEQILKETTTANLDSTRTRTTTIKPYMHETTKMFPNQLTLQSTKISSMKKQIKPENVRVTTARSPIKYSREIEYSNLSLNEDTSFEKEIQRLDLPSMEKSCAVFHSYQRDTNISKNIEEDEKDSVAIDNRVANDSLRVINNILKNLDKPFVYFHEVILAIINFICDVFVEIFQFIFNFF